MYEFLDEKRRKGETRKQRELAETEVKRKEKEEKELDEIKARYEKIKQRGPIVMGR